MSVQRLTAWAIVSLLFLSGCAAPAEKPAPRASASNPRGDLPSVAAARKVLRSAVNSILEERTTGFTYTLRIDSHVGLTLEGTAIAGEGWMARGTFQEPGDGVTSVAYFVADSTTTWMQMKDWPEPGRGCWLSMTATQVPLGISGLRPLEPAYIGVLADLAPSEAGTRDEIPATLTPDAVATLLPVRLLNLVGYKAGKSSTRDGGKVAVDIEDDRVTRLVLSGHEAGRALATAVGKLDPRHRQMLDTMEITIDYRRGDQKALLTTPSPESEVDQGDRTCTTKEPGPLGAI